MPKKKYQINLSDQEKQELKKFVSCGKKNAREINRARVLLLSNEGKSDTEIAKTLGSTRKTVHNIRKRFCENEHAHILDFLIDAHRGGRPIKFDSRIDANITMIACSEPPEGRANWTLKLIADRIVKLEIVDSISYESVRRSLKKTN